jgi:hypothetical protein
VTHDCGCHHLAEGFIRVETNDDVVVVGHRSRVFLSPGTDAAQYPSRGSMTWQSLL